MGWLNGRKMSGGAKEDMSAWMEKHTNLAPCCSAHLGGDEKMDGGWVEEEEDGGHINRLRCFDGSEAWYGWYVVHLLTIHVYIQR